jgi:hypothetical protein
MRWYGFRRRRWTEIHVDPAVDLAGGSAEQRGPVGPAHRDLLRRLGAEARPTWSTRALLACLETLRTGPGTASLVAVQDAWTDGPLVFCVVYRAPWPADRMGFRYAWSAVDDEHGCEACAGSDVGPPDPVVLGSTIGHALAQPLTEAAFDFDQDDAGVSWWGDLDAGPPPRGPEPAR